MDNIAKKALKQKYLDARKEAFASGKLDMLKHNSGAYTPQMLWALREMAENKVYPDGNFSDEECSVWEMFATFRPCETA